MDPERYLAVVTVTDPRDIAKYLSLFAAMSQAASSGEASRSRLAELASSPANRGVNVC
jgi:hypothetical protein